MSNLDKDTNFLYVVYALMMPLCSGDDGKSIVFHLSASNVEVQVENTAKLLSWYTYPVGFDSEFNFKSWEWIMNAIVEANKS